MLRMDRFYLMSGVGTPVSEEVLNAMIAETTYQDEIITVADHDFEHALLYFCNKKIVGRTVETKHFPSLTLFWADLEEDKVYRSLPYVITRNGNSLFEIK